MSGLSECDTAPRAVIVHDAPRWGALDGFAGAAGAAPERLLFQGVPDPGAYRAQLAAFHDALRGLVGEVLLLDGLVSGPATTTQFRSNPNHVFARDAAVTLPWAPEHFIACNMAEPLRRPEPGIMARALRAQGLTPLLALPNDLVLEGGDVIPFSRDGRRCLLIGHGPRTHLTTVAYMAERLIPEWLDVIIAFRLSPCRINLDGALCPVDRELAIANLDSLLNARRFDADGCRELGVRQAIDELGLAVIEVSFADSRARQACNCFCAGDRRVVMYDLCPAVAEAVAKAGLAVTLVPGAELVKGNGGPRCMTRPLYGDDTSA
jgi:N-dimethylarginine dimethylaminohydrolase